MTATDKELLGKMLKHIDEVAEDIGDMAYDDFLNSRIIQKSAVFDVAQIYELAKGTSDKHQSLKLTPETYAQIDGLYMKAISKTRAIAVHGYGSLDLNMLWSTLKNGLPKLREIISGVLKKA